MKKQLVDLIAQHIPNNVPTTTVPPNTTCAFTGVRLAQGTPIKNVIKPATSDLADTFPFTSDFVSVNTARCFQASRLLRGNLYITRMGITAPMVRQKSADKTGRPTWQQVFEHIQLPAVLILTDESKRRLWTKACLTSPSGRRVEGKSLQPDPKCAALCLVARTSDGCSMTFPSDTDTRCLKIFLNEGAVSRILSIDMTVFRAALGRIKQAIHAGFAKSAIRTTVFKQHNNVLKFGIQKTRQLEDTLQLHRRTPEFQVATFIATKT